MVGPPSALMNSAHGVQFLLVNMISVISAAPKKVVRRLSVYWIANRGQMGMGEFSVFRLERKVLFGIKYDALLPLLLD